MTFAIPLIVILGSYMAIIIIIYKRSKQSQVFRGSVRGECMTQKAKFHTIKVTGVLVLSFILCWTPYYSMTFW